MSYMTILPFRLAFLPGFGDKLHHMSLRSELNDFRKNQRKRKIGQTHHMVLDFRVPVPNICNFLGKKVGRILGPTYCTIPYTLVEDHSNLKPHLFCLREILFGKVSTAEAPHTHIWLLPPASLPFRVLVPKKGEGSKAGGGKRPPPID